MENKIETNNCKFNNVLNNIKLLLYPYKDIIDVKIYGEHIFVIPKVLINDDLINKQLELSELHDILLQHKYDIEHIKKFNEYNNKLSDKILNLTDEINKLKKLSFLQKLKYYYNKIIS